VSTPAAIEIQGVTKRFREKVAVDNLDLTVPTGSVCGFLGPNGAGKTTTIRMVMSIFYPDEGRISVLGKKSAAESKDRIGYLPEERGVYRKMKVGDFLSYIGTVKGVPKRDLSKRIDTWLEKVALPEVRKKKCAELSKGMQQKVQFLATVIHDPELVILDEPFSGLDPVNSRLLRGLIEEMRRDGKTIIFSTHVLHSAEQLCDRIFMINNGRKILDGSVGDIRSQFDPKTITIKTLNSQTDASKIERIEGVASVFHPAPDVIEARLADGAQPSRVMADVLAATPVRGVELRQATLEDVFVQLVDPGDSEDSVRSALSDLGAGGTNGDS
jgi:ABC-2 type transport system ATP-binding protein